MVMESATLPIPSEVVLPLAGYLVYTGQMNFLIVLIVASVGSLIGTVIDYSIGYYLGRPAILHYGRYVRLNESHLKVSEDWFAKYGNVTVLFARFVPLIRTLVAFPAGIAEMRMWKFLLFSVIGIVAWDAVLIYLGFVFGKEITSALSSAFTPIEVIALLLAILVIVLYTRRSLRKVKGKDEPSKNQVP